MGEPVNGLGPESLRRELFLYLSSGGLLRSAIDTSRFIDLTLLTHVRHLVDDESFKSVTTPKV